MILVCLRYFLLIQASARLAQGLSPARQRVHQLQHLELSGDMNSQNIPVNHYFLYIQHRGANILLTHNPDILHPPSQRNNLHQVFLVVYALLDCELMF